MKHSKVQWAPHEDDLPGFRCLPIFNFIWLALMSIAIVLIWSISIDSKQPVREKGLILKRQPHYEQPTRNNTQYPFNIMNGMMGEIIRLPKTGGLPIDFGKLKHYYVCCHTSDRSYFVCHSVTRNIGIDCVIRQEKTSKLVYAAVVVQHPDMFGSTCALHWSY